MTVEELHESSSESNFVALPVVLQVKFEVDHRKYVWYR